MTTQEIRTIQIPTTENAFFKAISIAYYNEETFHALMRSWVMNHFQGLGYKELAETDDIWTSPYNMTALNVLSTILNVRILFYEYQPESQTIKKHVFGDAAQNIKILRKDLNTYEVLKFHIDI